MSPYHYTNLIPVSENRILFTQLSLFSRINFADKTGRKLCIVFRGNCAKNLKLLWRMKISGEAHVYCTSWKMQRAQSNEHAYYKTTCCKLTHIAVQSKCTMSHLEGLNANELAFSTPFIQPRNSGQMKALPAYAASTCNHKSEKKCNTARKPSSSNNPLHLPKNRAVQYCIADIAAYYW